MLNAPSVADQRLADHDGATGTPDEVLVETHDTGARTLHVQVEKAGTTKHTKASQWRFVKTARGADGEEVENHAYQVILQCNPVSGCPGT